MNIPVSYRAPWDLKALTNESAFLADLGLEFIALGTDGAEFELEIQPRHLNAEGRVHGGVIATLLDAACGLPVRVVGEGEDLVRAVTLTLSVDYIAAPVSGRVRASGRISGGGRNIIFSRAEVTDAGGALVATASGSFKRLRSSDARSSMKENT